MTFLIIIWVFYSIGCAVYSIVFDEDGEGSELL